MGFFIAEPEHLEFKHDKTTQIKILKKQKNLLRNKKTSGRFLNRYDFAYTGRDTVNQVPKPGGIKNASNEINNVAKQRINQIITEGGKEVESILSKILRGAMEDVY